MKLFSKLDKCYKVSILTLLVSIIGLIATSYFFTINKMDIPLGIIFGGIVLSFIYFLQGIGEKRDGNSGNTTWTLVFIILKFVILVACSFVIGFMYYRWNMPYLNLFSFIGVYTVSIINMAVVYLVDKK